MTIFMLFHQMILTGQLKEKLVELKIKDNVVHAGHLVLLELCNLGLKLKVRALIFQNNN